MVEIPKSCKAYANNALAQQRLNQSRGCGFGGDHWHLNYNKHYNWCLNITPTLRSQHTKSRQNALARCSKKPPVISIGSTWKVVEACTSDELDRNMEKKARHTNFRCNLEKLTIWPGTIKDVIDLKRAVNGQVSLYRHGVPGTYTGQLSADGRRVRNGNATWYNGNCVWTAEIRN